MEFNISDLLDEMQDESVQLKQMNIASSQRVKELTMMKLEKREKPQRSARVLGRLVLVAAILLSLATTVLAVSGFRFFDWTNQRSGEGFEEDVFYGSGSMFWEIGERMFRMSVKESSPTGATLEWWSQDDGTGGKLTTDDSYWLEKWDGNEYVPLEPVKEAVWQEKVYEIPEGEVPLEFYLDWEMIYGQLDTGYYRIGKVFTLTCNGESQTVEGYAKFRIFTREMEPYLEKCRAAFNALLAQESYHIYIRDYPGVYNSSMDYTYLSKELWKSEDNMLMQGKRFLETEGEAVQLDSGDGTMLRDGKGYGLEWENGDVNQPVAYWQSLDHIKDVSYYDFLLIGIEWYENKIGEVCENGNEIILVGTTYSEEYPYEEYVLTFGEAGNLTGITHYVMPEQNCPEEEKVLYTYLEVRETPAEEIRRLIASQDVTNPNAFSWAEEHNAYPDAKRSGFVNTTARTGLNSENIAELALRETDLTADDMEAMREERYYNKTRVFYDDAAGIWKVEFSCSQESWFQAVYLNDEGITQMVVKGELEE